MENENSNSYSRFLLVTVGERHFGLALSDIREAIALPEITPLPASPKFFMGIISLRGTVIPVIDMAAKMGIKEKYNGDPLDQGVVICQIHDQYYGIVVDAIESVISVQVSQISAVPQLSNENTSFISGIYKGEAGLTILIEPSLIVEKNDLTAIVDNAKLSA